MAWLKKLSDTLTVDQIASLTDAEMVRRRFDSSNITWITAMSAFSFLVAIAQVFSALFRRNVEPYMPPLALAHFAFAFFAAAFFGELATTQRSRGTRRPRLPVHVLARNLTPWVLAYLIAEFAFLTLFRERNSDAWIGWAMIYPWFLIPVRLEISRRLGLHLSLLGVAVINALLLGTMEKKNIPEFTTVTLMSAVTLFIGAMTSRRMRRVTIEEWTDRREQAREQVRMRDELQYAREVQLSMLPETSPAVDWVDLAGTSVPATEVGGDYYDYFVDDRAIAIVCGDVAGHGLASGIVLASLRSGFTLLRDSLDEPAAVLQRLNDLVAQTSRRRMLATAAVLRLDRVSQRATIASAGHPPIIVRRSGAVESIELFAPPLGVRLPYRVPSAEVAFGRGDVFVLHSDGVYESVNAAGESYGLDRIASVLANVDGQSAAMIRDAIIRDVEAFRGTIMQADDVTVVVACIT